ncbi:hypothetical protein BGLY_3468 [Bacillus glycinifermentans]|nr:hypothetical protein BGLY_3468 [Bacillus glycinifermentans]
MLSTGNFCNIIITKLKPSGSSFIERVLLFVLIRRLFGIITHKAAEISIRYLLDGFLFPVSIVHVSLF